MEERYVVVTSDNERRGVFGGKLIAHEGDTVTLENARMAVHWSADVHGVVGLAANGPSSSCRISPAAPSAKLNGITAVFDMSDAAKEAWEKEPWG